MRLKTAFQIGLEGRDLAGHLGRHGHQRAHLGPVGGCHRGRGVQAGGPQELLDGLGSGLDVALATAPAQAGPDGRRRQLGRQSWGGSPLEHPHRIGVGQVGAEGLQRGGEVLPQDGAQPVELALAVPDGPLVGPGQHLGGLG